MNDSNWWTINSGEDWQWVWNKETQQWENKMVIPITIDTTQTISNLNMSTEKPTSQLIDEVCEELRSLLQEKNRRYGDSAISPIRIFSDADPLEQICIRIDDKISRIISGQLDEDEDVIDDLIGYLILYKVALRKS